MVLARGDELVRGEAVRVAEDAQAAEGRADNPDECWPAASGDRGTLERR